MAKKSGTCIRQFMIGLGFLSGLRTAMGIDPGEVILKVPGTTAGILYPDPDIRYLFLILPVILLLISIIRAYMNGRVHGRAASLLPAWLDCPFSFPPCQH